MSSRNLQLRMNTLLSYRHIYTHTQSIVKQKKNLSALLVPFEGLCLPKLKRSPIMMHNQASRIQARFSPRNKEFLSMPLIFIFFYNLSNNEGHCKPQSTHFTACYSLYKTTASNSKLKYVLFFLTHAEPACIDIAPNYQVIITCVSGKQSSIQLLLKLWETIHQF